MAGLFGIRRSSGSTGSSDVPQNTGASPAPAVPAAAMSMLEGALQKWLHNWAAAAMYIPSRAIQNLVRERTLQTLREWFTVKDEDLGENNPPCLVCGSFNTSNSIRKGLSLADVTNWVYHWDMETFKIGGRATSRELNAIPHNLDGASEHHKRLQELRRLKREKDNQIANDKLDREFHEMLNRLSAIAKTPISYTPDDMVPVVDERSMYAEFADQLRQHGLEESIVFDRVAALSKLVQESRAILPRLTPDAVKQFEARILLEFYRERQDAIYQLMRQQELEAERTQAVKDAAAAARDTSEAIADMSSRLASLNTTTAGQAHDVATIKWVDMLDSLFGH